MLVNKELMSHQNVSDSRSSDVKKAGDYSHVSVHSGVPGHSSPRPVATPRINTAVHHHNNNSGFIGPQLPPHMTKVQDPRKDT